MGLWFPWVTKNLAHILVVSGFDQLVPLVDVPGLKLAEGVLESRVDPFRLALCRRGKGQVTNVLKRKADVSTKHKNHLQSLLRGLLKPQFVLLKNCIFMLRTFPHGAKKACSRLSCRNQFRTATPTRSSQSVTSPGLLGQTRCGSARPTLGHSLFARPHCKGCSFEQLSSMNPSKEFSCCLAKSVMKSVESWGTSKLCDSQACFHDGMSISSQAIFGEVQISRIEPKSSRQSSGQQKSADGDNHRMPLSVVCLQVVAIWCPFGSSTISCTWS